MLTLMPVAAFADTTSTYIVEKASVKIDSLNGSVQVTATTGSVYSVGANNALTLVGPVPATVNAAGDYVVISGTAPATLPAEAAVVTVTANDLLKASSKAAYDHSAILTKDRNASVEVGEYADVRLLVQNKWNLPAKADKVYVWATQGTSKAPVTGLLINDATATLADENVEGVYELSGSFQTTATGAKAFSVGFTSGGATYTIHASFEKPTFEMVKLQMQKN